MEKKLQTYICCSFHTKFTYLSKLKFVNLYKLYFLLTYNPENGTEDSMGESDLGLNRFLCNIILLTLSHYRFFSFDVDWTK